MRIEPGTSLGPYRIVELVGSGGMGEVYRARDSRLGRDVAVKVLNASPDADRLTRFEREARATALLAHPNILTIFDIGTHEGAPFLVCELLEGQTLGDRLAAGPLSSSEAMGLALQLARGVAAAHALRVVHRDIKPANLFLARGGNLKVLDFGLAKLKAVSLVLDDETVDESSPGMLIGTPGYMAPEQVRGAMVDERTDIFAIGAVLHEMLTARPPFARNTPAETLAAILHESPAPLGAGVATALERIVRRCLAKEPGDRFQSASELAVALEAARGGAQEPRGAPKEPGAVPPPASIAVLPFLDMSPGRDHDYLCDGIAEELIGALTHVEGLRVTARSTSFQFRDSVADARAVGARLGVDTVLEGGVRRIGDRLRVTVQLVDVADGYQRWSQRFDGRMEDVFDMQDQIAESVATALRGILTLGEKDALRRPETEVEAYELFLRGRRLVHSLSRSSAAKAAELFEQVIAIDAGYAPAYAGLAQVHGFDHEWLGGGDAAVAKADRASARALELAPHLADAHTARGFVLALRRQHEAAAAEFEEAIRLNPNSFDAYYLYARAAFSWGDIELSAEMFRRGGDVQPEDFQCPLLLSQSLRMLGRREEAAAANREGIRRAERRLELDPRDTRALSLGGSALMDDGQPERAIEWASLAAAISPEDPTVLVNAACMYAKRGDKEKALVYLDGCFAKGFGKRDWVEHDPDYDILRDDPRFQAMLEKLP